MFSKLIFIFWVLSIGFIATADADMPIEKKGPTIKWHVNTGGNCVDSQFDTVDAALGCLVAGNTPCLTSQGNPDLWYVGANSYQVCNPPNNISEPVFIATAATIGAIG